MSSVPACSPILMICVCYFISGFNVTLTYPRSYCHVPLVNDGGTLTAYTGTSKTYCKRNIAGHLYLTILALWSIASNLNKPNI